MVIEISLDASIAGQALFRKPFLAAAGDIEDRLGHFAGIAQHVGRRDLHDVDAVAFLPAFARAILAMLERVVIDLDREMRFRAVEWQG